MIAQPTLLSKGYLPEADGHTVFFSEYGNPDGPVILTIHGGPGSSSKPDHALRFPLEKYRVILFDQRGCGLSTPSAQLEHNTTPDLVADMERLQQHLEIDHWYVSGSSWGSTLALTYAQAHPEHVLGLLLSAVFLGRSQDVTWAVGEAHGTRRIFPELYALLADEAARLGVGYPFQASELLRELQSAPEMRQKELVAMYLSWESNLMSAFSPVTLLTADEITEKELAYAQIFLHYESHDAFLRPNQLLANMASIAHIPAVIVHGRYDLLCPLDGAWELARAFEHAELLILPSSNHAFTAEGEVVRRVAFEKFLTQNQ